MLFIYTNEYIVYSRYRIKRPLPCYTKVGEVEYEYEYIFFYGTLAVSILGLVLCVTYLSNCYLQLLASIGSGCKVFNNVIYGTHTVLAILMLIKAKDIFYIPIEDVD